jgi:hypothetical protein
MRASIILLPEPIFLILMLPNPRLFLILTLAFFWPSVPITMVMLSFNLALLPLISNVKAFSTIIKFSASTKPASLRQSQFSGTSLNVGANLDPEGVFPLERSITPEGYGFSSSIQRVLKESGRDGGFYKASSSDLVTDVMDGITGGSVDVALVFDDSSKLLGIFTESDYIKV